MRRIFVLCFSLLLVISVQAKKMNESWSQAKTIEKNILRTKFPNTIYSILDFGAVSNDTSILQHDAINNAILRCSQNGGGRVIVPSGKYLTGPITLKSNVNLVLEEGAVLKFSTRKELYLPPVLTRWEGIDCYNYRPLVYAYGETNVALTGKGVIDGQGSNETWWSMCGATKFGWAPGKAGQNLGGRARLLQAAEDNLSMERRIFGEADALRPQLVQFNRCNKVLIEGVTLLNSPFWMIHPLLCTNVVVRGVSMINDGPNGDGCDPESCSGVLIENCFFDTGDDCIAIKSGRNNDGRKWAMPTENMIVRNCEMKNGHGGVVIGSEISGGCRNLFVEDCNMDSPNLDRVIRIKTNTCRGGLIENIHVRNIKVGECREAVLKINLVYEQDEKCQRDFPPTVRNVYLENVQCSKSRYGVLITGLEGDRNVYGINVFNCVFDGVKEGNKVSGASDVNFNSLMINGKPVD